jgi:hypothetical protein
MVNEVWILSSLGLGDSPLQGETESGAVAVKYL